MKRPFIITIFGDLRGFKKWHRNVASAPEIKQPFMKRYFRAIENLVEKHPGQLKMFGDGFALLLKVDVKNGQRQKKILNILNDLKQFTLKILQYIHECEWPPEGFRLRTTAGYADAYKVFDEIEYIGDLINLCQQLLYIRPEIPIVNHITMVKPLCEKRKRLITLIKVNVTARDIYRVSELIDPNDMKDLYEMPIK